MKNKDIIGVVGGVGPYAGTDFIEKIFDNTKVHKDQDHLPIALVSYPEIIPDRTEFILGQSDKNPAFPIAEIILNLEKLGATLIAIPCNTSHSPEIFDVIKEELKQNNSKVTLCSMIEETMLYVKEHFPRTSKIGLLATTGTCTSDVYGKIFSQNDISIVYPDKDMQTENVHDAIYNEEYGIKACSAPVSDVAIKKLEEASAHLRDKGAEMIIMGCTEIPLALKNTDKIFFIDPSIIFARALIQKVDPGKLIEA